MYVPDLGGLLASLYLKLDRQPLIDLYIDVHMSTCLYSLERIWSLSISVLKTLEEMALSSNGKEFSSFSDYLESLYEETPSKSTKHKAPALKKGPHHPQPHSSPSHPDPEGETIPLTCSNCRATKSSNGWHLDPETRKRTLCNACGQYVRRRRAMRPPSLFASTKDDSKSEVVPPRYRKTGQSELPAATAGRRKTSRTARRSRRKPVFNTGAGPAQE
ncbi:hypothetical protein B0H10DRAFT_39707 [Mycena sp. CBHHK59/15]|nr:hypothetical protein B0H10DRAFT_39707 [Mycena sp. CBHHK59/15]